MKFNISGFSLVEIMVSLAIAGFIGLILIGSYTTQASIFTFQGWRSKSVEEGRDVFLLLHKLLRHAESDSITIYKKEDSFTVDLTVPEKYAIWPNVIPPFDKNQIRIKWHKDDNNHHKLQISNAKTKDAIENAKLVTLIGHPGSSNTDINQFNLVPTSSGFILSLTSNIGDINSYSSSTGYEGHVIPRN